MSSDTERITNEVMDRLEFCKLGESGAKTYPQELADQCSSATDLLFANRGYQEDNMKAHEGPAKMR
jgi:hypothetical protein